MDKFFNKNSINLFIIKKNIDNNRFIGLTLKVTNRKLQSNLALKCTHRL